jgi:mitochondrial chaperone BCS1
MVSALAAHFGLSIYVINLADFNDRTLMNAVNQVPANSVLLFEDIDCASGGKARATAGEGSQAEAAKGASLTNVVTLSGLLNVLDGFYAPANVLFVMTTNKIEALDPALLRPGRIDYKLLMGNATSSQKLELYRRFFPEVSGREAVAFVESHFAETMAEFQGLLLRIEEGRDKLAEVEEEAVAV